MDKYEQKVSLVQNDIDKAQKEQQFYAGSCIGDVQKIIAALQKEVERQNKNDVPATCATNAFEQILVEGLSNVRFCKSAINKASNEERVLKGVLTMFSCVDKGMIQGGNND